jgi:ACS family pantothenate transporter-like MFS transporter
MGYEKEDVGPYSLDTESGNNDSKEQLIVRPIKTWRGYIWDTWELPKDQRWLLFKLDAFVLTFASVSTSPISPLLTSSSSDMLFFRLDTS